MDILAGLIKDEAGIAVLHIPDGCITDLFNAVPRLLEDLMVKQWRQYRGDLTHTTANRNGQWELLTSEDEL